jgi:hypothetical protein
MNRILRNGSFFIRDRIFHLLCLVLCPHQMWALNRHIPTYKMAKWIIDFLRYVPMYKVNLLFHQFDLDHFFALVEH